ncbi:hypothetical protein DXG01_006782 [Tephrocybe rancida]|nr:hypothetical protein DXG01_006782 [Tephrocybe rancida]
MLLSELAALVNLVSGQYNVSAANLNQGKSMTAWGYVYGSFYARTVQKLFRHQDPVFHLPPRVRQYIARVVVRDENFIVFGYVAKLLPPNKALRTLRTPALRFKGEVVVFAAGNPGRILTHPRALKAVIDLAALAYVFTSSCIMTHLTASGSFAARIKDTYELNVGVEPYIQVPMAWIV